MLFMAPGAACINLYGHGARWTDMGFGVLQRIAAEMGGLTYLQVLKRRKQNRW